MRIEAWLRLHAPPLAQELKPGAAAAEIEVLEKTLGFPLPSELKASLRIHNGGGFCFAYQESEVLSAAKIRESVTLMNEVEFPDPDYWSRSWIPFVGESSFLCLDRKSARVVEFIYGRGRRETAFATYGAWLRSWADSLDGGKYYFDGEALQIAKQPLALPNQIDKQSTCRKMLEALIEVRAIDVEPVNLESLSKHLSENLSAQNSAAKLESFLLDSAFVEEVYWPREIFQEFLSEW